MPDVFLSFASCDRAIAEEIARLLETAFDAPDGAEKTVRCMGTASGDFTPTNRFYQQITDEVKAAPVMIALISRRSLKSRWVQYETNARIASGKPLLPAFLPGMDETSLPEPVRAIHGLHCTTLTGLFLLLESVQNELPHWKLRKADKYVSIIEGLVSRGRGRESKSVPFVPEHTLEQFEANCPKRSRFAEPRMRRWLIEARRAVHEAAEVIDEHWSWAEQQLASASSVRVPKAGRGWVPLVGAIISMKIIQRFLSLPDKYRCAIMTDDQGLIDASPRDSEYAWVVDAIDGGRHMARGLPLFSVALALVDRQYRPVLGMIYAPVSRELFFAAVGIGAFANSWDRPIQLRELGHDIAADTLVHMEFPNNSTASTEEFDQLVTAATKVFRHASRIRGLGLGSLGLAYTAKGAFDGYITFASGTTRCDVLAGELLVKCAGGEVEPVPVRCLMEHRPRPGDSVQGRADGFRWDADRIHENRWIIAGRRDVVSQVLELLKDGGC
jgi:fructose-1,6-bisphosphatase/inositol monophosphatase family enzyme